MAPRLTKTAVNRIIRETETSETVRDVEVWPEERLVVVTFHDRFENAEQESPAVRELASALRGHGWAVEHVNHRRGPSTIEIRPR
jgi:hypothetical protein